MYILDNRSSKCKWQKVIELKGEIDESTIIVVNFNTKNLKQPRFYSIGEWLNK